MLYNKIICSSALVGLWPDYAHILHILNKQQKHL